MGMLPYYIPTVSLENLDIFIKLSRYFPYAILPAYLVNPEEVDDINRFIKSVSTKLILSSIMPDEYLVRKNTLDKFLEILDKLDIDIVIAWDTPTYLEDSDDLRRERLNYSFEVVKQISDMGYGVIPLVKGAYTSEIHEYTNKLLELGFQTLAFHITQYLTSHISPLPYLENELYDKPSDYMYRLIREILSFNEIQELIIIGGSGYHRYKWMLEFDERIRVAGYSWYIDALGYSLYTLNGKKRIFRKQFICKCPVCNGKKPLELRNIDSIALHNIYYIRQMASHDEYPHDIKIHDIILDDEDLLIAGPIHVGDKYSLWMEMLDRVREYKPRYLVLAGDIFYNDISEDTVLEWRKFLDRLETLHHKYGVIVYPMRGVMEERPYPLTRRYDFLGVSRLDPLTMWMKKTAYDNTLLRVTRFLTGAGRNISVLRLDDKREYIEIFYDNPADKYSVEEVHNYLSRRKMGRDKWIISTLLGKPTINQELKVATPGIWHNNPYYNRVREPGFIYIPKKGEPKILY